MKRALSFIAATVVTTSVYSQPYTGSSASQDALMEQARQRIYETTQQSSSGAPASSQLESSSGFERSAGSSNSSTGQSNGSNLNGGYSTPSSEGAAVTKDSDISGLEKPQAAASSESLNGEAKKLDFYGALNTPDLEGDYIKSLGEESNAKVYNGTDYWKQGSVGAPASGQSGAVSSDDKEMKKDCDADKAHKAQTWNDAHPSSDATVRGSGTAVDSDERYRINREQGAAEDQYHVNREAGSPVDSEASGNAAVSESGTRSSGTAVDADERARLERESRSSTDTEASGPHSGNKQID